MKFIYVALFLSACLVEQAISEDLAFKLSGRNLRYGLLGVNPFATVFLPASVYVGGTGYFEQESNPDWPDVFTLENPNLEDELTTHLYTVQLVTIPNFGYAKFPVQNINDIAIGANFTVKIETSSLIPAGTLIVHRVPVPDPEIAKSN